VVWRTELLKHRDCTLKLPFFQRVVHDLAQILAHFRNSTCCGRWFVHRWQKSVLYLSRLNKDADITTCYKAHLRTLTGVLRHGSASEYFCHLLTYKRQLTGMLSNSSNVRITGGVFTNIEQHDVKLTGARAVFI